MGGKCVHISNGAVFLLIYRQFRLLKLTFEERDNTAVNAAILCPAVCVCDVISRARICGVSIKYVMLQRSGVNRHRCAKSSSDTKHDDDELMLNVLRCHLTH